MTSIAERIARETSDQSEQAEELLKQIIQEDRPPNFGELTFFARIGWGTRADVDRQIHRMRKVLEFQAVAGSSADRDKLEQAVTSAEAALETEGERILQEIAALHAKYDKLRSTAANLAKRRDDSADAVKRLMELAPPFMRHMYNSELHAINETIRARIHEFEIERNHRLRLLDQKSPRDADWVIWAEAVQRFDRSMVLINPLTGRFELTEKYSQHRPTWEAEIASIEEQLIPMREEYEMEMARVNELLSYHVPV